MKNTTKKTVTVDSSRAKRDRVLTGFRNALGFKQRHRALRTIARMDAEDERRAQN